MKNTPDGFLASIGINGIHNIIRKHQSGVFLIQNLWFIYMLILRKEL